MRLGLLSGGYLARPCLLPAVLLFIVFTLESWKATTTLSTRIRACMYRARARTQTKSVSLLSTFQMTARACDTHVCAWTTLTFEVKTGAGFPEVRWVLSGHMENEPDENEAKRSRESCGWPKADGSKCGWPAGHRTGHEGYGACAFHGGSGPYIEGVWEEAMSISEAEGITPWDALLHQVRVAHARAAWVDQRWTEAVKKNDGEPDHPEVMRWLRESRKERGQASRTAKAAIDAGVAERMVRQVEMEGAVIVRVLAGTLDRITQLLEDAGVETELIQSTRVEAHAFAHRELLELESPEDLVES